MLPYTTVVISGLRLGYNSSNIRYIFCIKPFKAFLERPMSKDKPTPLRYDYINWEFKVPVLL